jgi:hypothetical protein
MLPASLNGGTRPSLSSPQSKFEKQLPALDVPEQLAFRPQVLGTDAAVAAATRAATACDRPVAYADPAVGGGTYPELQGLQATL